MNISTVLPFSHVVHIHRGFTFESHDSHLNQKSEMFEKYICKLVTVNLFMGIGTNMSRELYNVIMMVLASAFVLVACHE